MMKGIMNTRVAALALAASALFTPVALADHGKRSGVSVSVSTGNGAFIYRTGSTSHVYDGRYSQSRYYSGDRYYGRHGLNQYGQTRSEVRQLRRTAARACRAAIRDKASYLGFRDVDFDDGRNAYQIGPRGFVITFNEVEFEKRRREIETPVRCTVRRGTRVTQLEGIPERRGRHYRDSHYVW